MTTDWRVDSHDRQIGNLKDDLREAKGKCWNDLCGAKAELRKEFSGACQELRKELRGANDKIWALERRPLDWVAKAMPVIAALLLGAYIALVIAGVIHRH